MLAGKISINASIHLHDYCQTKAVITETATSSLGSVDCLDQGRRGQDECLRRNLQMSHATPKPNRPKGDSGGCQGCLGTPLPLPYRVYNNCQTARLAIRHPFGKVKQHGQQIETCRHQHQILSARPCSHTHVFTRPRSFFMHNIPYRFLIYLSFYLPIDQSPKQS